MDDLCTCGAPNGCMIHRERSEEPLAAEEAQAVLDLLDGRAVVAEAGRAAKAKLQRIARSGHKRRW